MKNRFKKLMGLGILAAVVIAAVPAVDVAAVEANDIVNTATETRRDPDGSVWIKESEPEPQANGFTNSATEIRRDPDGTIWIKAPEHKHKWSDVFHVSLYDAIGVYCTNTVDYYGTCKYQGKSNATPLIKIIAKDEEYSGKPYSSYQIEGKEKWLEFGGELGRNLLFVGNNGTKYRSNNPPKEVGTYAVSTLVNKGRGICNVLLLGKEFRILESKNTNPNGNAPVNNENINQDDNTQGNSENVNANGNMPANDSQNSNIPAGNEPASQSITPEGNEPTKPAFENKDCMDKVKDMAGKEIKNQ